ncbi:MAG: type II secretion system F family protein [Patescibacteria group bacterium]
MTLFSFKTIKQGEKSQEGTVEAANKSAAFEKLMKKGETVVFVREVRKDAFSLKQVGELFRHVSIAEKIVFAHTLGSMIEAGLSLSRALSVIDRQIKNKKLKEVVGKLIDGINKGDTMSDSMAHFPEVFSSLFVSMVKAGEESGNLAESLHVVSSQLEKNYALTKRIQGALIYPAIIVLLMLAIAILMLVYVIPTLSKTFKELGVPLPPTTQFLISTSDFVSANFILVIAGIFALFIGIFFAARTKQGKRTIDFALLHFPVINVIVKEINSARTARTLSSLLSAGVDLIVAIRITGDVLQNSFYKDIIRQAEIRVEKGENISAVLSSREDLYPIFVSEMAVVGEETGKLSQMFMGVAQFYENEVDQKTKDLSTVIEPILMIVIGIAVGFFVTAMIGPTYSLVNVI